MNDDVEVTEDIEGLDLGDTCKVRVYDIDWDTGDPEETMDTMQLPREVELEVNVDDLEDGDPESYLADVLSDEYGHTIFRDPETGKPGFSWDYDDEDLELDAPEDVDECGLTGCDAVTEEGPCECTVEQLNENALTDLFKHFGDGIKGILKLCGKGLLVVIAGLGGSFLFGLPGLLIAVMIAFGLLTNDKVTEGKLAVNEGLLGDVKDKLKTVINLLKADPKKAKEINARALAAKKAGDKKALQACADEIKAMSKGSEEKPVTEDDVPVEVTEDDEPESRVRQISIDIIPDGTFSDDEILHAVEDALMNVECEVVGGPEFTDASWSRDEYGL